MLQDEIAKFILDKRIGFREIAGILGRLFREEDLKGVRTINGVSLAELSGFRTTWTYFITEPPVTKTIGEHVEDIARYLRREIIEALGEAASPEEAAKIAAGWVQTVLRLAVLDIISVKGEPENVGHFLSGSWESRFGEAPMIESLALDDGFRIDMERLRFSGDSSEAPSLGFACFRARLFAPSGKAVAYALVNVIRKRRRREQLTAETFTYNMDIPDDDLARLGIRLMEVASSPSELFDNGDLVSVQDIVTASDQRQKGYAKRLLVAVLKDMKRRYKGIGTLVIPLSAESILVTPSNNAPPELRLMYLSATAPARRMFADSRISREAFGPRGKTLCFDEGAQLNDIEMFMERFESIADIPHQT